MALSTEGKLVSITNRLNWHGAAHQLNLFDFCRPPRRVRLMNANLRCNCLTHEFITRYETVTYTGKSMNTVIRLERRRVFIRLNPDESRAKALYCKVQISLALSLKAIPLPAIQETSLGDAAIAS
jgi:hypothetical protein